MDNNYWLEVMFNCFVVLVVVVFYIGFDGKINYSFFDKIVKVEFIDKIGCVIFVGVMEMKFLCKINLSVIFVLYDMIELFFYV